MVLPCYTVFIYYIGSQSTAREVPRDLGAVPGEGRIWGGVVMPTAHPPKLQFLQGKLVSVVWRLIVIPGKLHTPSEFVNPNLLCIHGSNFNSNIYSKFY